MSTVFITFEKVKEYVDANIPILPLKVNGDPHVHYLYDNKSKEDEKLASNLSENAKKLVYSGGHILPLKLLNQQIPSTFWTDERIRNQQWYGIGVKTGLTAIPAKSDPNKVLLIIGLDADDQKTKTVLENLIKQYSLLAKTLVQNTPHGGLHLVFAVAVDPNNWEEIKFWEDKSKLQAVCKDGCKIELKSHNMQITLDPTRHRRDQHLTYTRISKVIAISEEPMFYEVLVKALKDADCISETPEEYLARRENQSRSDSSSKFNRSAPRSDLTENEIIACIDIILGRDDENKKDNSPFGSIYTVGYRNDACMSLSGFFYWSHITQASAETVIRRIAEETNDGSADVNKAVSNVAVAYIRGDNGDPVRGKSGVIEEFRRCHKYKDETLAKQRLVKLQDAINVQRKKPQLSAEERKERAEKEPRQSDIVVQLARQRIPLLFKNQFKEYCAVIKVNEWYEVVTLEDQSFSSALRFLWIEENIAKNRPMITTIAEDQLKRAKDTLISETFLKNADEANYQEEDLDAVARSYIGEGKIETVSGVNVELLPPNQQMEYCLHDAQLCYKMLQKKDFELSQIIYEISAEIKMTFFETCNAGYPTEWWRSKLASINYQKVPSDVQIWIDQNMTTVFNPVTQRAKKTGVKYLGGLVIPPLMGRHLNAVSYDVSSMYPTMANIHNLSTETVCCSCCANNPDAKIPDSVMNDINSYLLEDGNKAKKKEARPWHYWICQKKHGKFAVVMKDLYLRKIECKEAGLKLKEKAMKILMNSGYGGFGNAYFEYQDPRVAELITAYGQHTLKSLADFVGKENVLYGDTDSIYLVSANDKIIAEARDKYNVRLEVDTVWKILFLTSNKKQYVGLTERGDLKHTTLTGMKSNQPSYYNEVAEKLISKEFLEAFIDTSEDIAQERIIKYVQSAFMDLQLSDNLDKLSFSLKSKDALYTHTRNDTQKQIYTEILEDCNGDTQIAKSKSESGRVYRYWKIKEKKKTATIHPERYQLDMRKYREGLFNCIESMLEVYGMSSDEISQLRKELVENQNMLYVSTFSTLRALEL